MKGVNLGEFEELVLLMVGIEYAEAYGVSLQRGIEENTGRTVKISAVHSALHRLGRKGYVTSQMGGASASRGGRRKRLFNLTDSGRKVIEQRRQERSRLWDLMPRLTLQPVRC
ncbi:MAG: PadR family transcriptional regulator PadR [Rhodothermales bacterium]|jgi:PadR family transcriptional regulator PadR